MAKTSTLPFDGIFDRVSPGHGGDKQWHWNDPDLNVSASELINHVDKILKKFAAVNLVWLVTIELDLVQGRFPDLFKSFFEDPTWDYTTRFFVPAILKDSNESSCEVGTLVCELRPGRLRQLLGFDKGFRWGSALRVGAVQVPLDSVSLVLNGSLFDSQHATLAEMHALCAWAAVADLNAIAIWTHTHDPAPFTRLDVA